MPRHCARTPVAARLVNLPDAACRYVPCMLRPNVRVPRRSRLRWLGERYRVAVRIRDFHVADTVRVSLDWLMFDAFGSQALQERIESGNGEGDPARARPRCVRLNKERGMVLDVQIAESGGNRPQPCATSV